ncbi:hypothetical protein SAMN04488130_1206 [Flavobacterium urumqiense]|uniref:SGNH/GDSL hydrolase family protein n=1 Tax=Flavobacterium urumqiense TaxID=935224 RepID=A0A1H6ATR3_9FLAO|nr:hypothetical protein SAMN04488130_1206 [Flavobacterium urumqiense]
MMKRFLFFIIKILLLIFIVLVLLDVAYTQVYLQSTHRGKIDYVYNSKARNYDVVILGSSRANNHFVAPLFEEKGLKTFNYGMSGGHLFEASLLVKLMVERHYKIKNVILEADLNLANEQQSESVASKFLPYIHSSKVIKAHFAQQPHFWANYYIPFYRYIVFEPQIGFREMYEAAAGKPTKLLDHLGYYPLGKNPNANMKNDLTNLKPLNNRYYEEIKEVCKVNKINLVAVMTPMCTNTKGLDYFEKVHQVYPEIYNYENVVVGDQYFSSCGHMNDIGARLFTNIIISEFFKK